MTTYTPEQRYNAGIIIKTGEEMGLDDQTISAALATAMMESKLKNLSGGDRDSVGLFQQRPSQGWGTAAQINDPAYAARKFFTAYTKAKGSTVLEKIANTQRPAEQYRTRYADYFGQANDLFGSISGRPTPILTLPSNVQPHATTGSAAVSTPASTTAPELAPDSPPDVIEKYIRKNYPDVAGLLDNPELHKILFDAAVQGLDDIELQARVRQTDYWKNNGPAGRAWDILHAKDEAAATQQYLDAGNKLQAAVDREGLTLTDAEANEITTRMVRSGWNDADLNRYIAGKMQGEQKAGKPLTGNTGFSADQLRQVANQYMVPIDRGSAESWAIRISTGNATAEQYTKYVTDLAVSRFPWLKEEMATGMTPTQYFAPAKNQIANLLEMSPTQVDLLNDPKFASVVDYFDPATNVRRSRTLAETTDYVRHLPEFAKTHQYQQQDARLKTRLLETFGAVA